MRQIRNALRNDLASGFATCHVAGAFIPELVELLSRAQQRVPYL
jgi:hypothetical protein